MAQCLRLGILTTNLLIRPTIIKCYSKKADGVCAGEYEKGQITNVIKRHQWEAKDMEGVEGDLTLWFKPDIEGGITSLGKGKKKLGKLGPMIEKKVLPVETDTTKLTTFVCGSNISKEGVDVKIKPDNEYPDWLWTIRTGKPPPLEELDPESMEYWRRIRTMGRRRNNQLAKLKKF